MQLVAYGAQDIYLTGNPMITYFKVVYRRHTNFAMESIQQTFNGTVGFSNRVTALISRNGDLISGMTLEATLPNITSGAVAGNTVRWVNNVGHFLMRQVEVEIGGQLIDRHYDDWLEIWAQLTVPADKRLGYRWMVGQDLLTAGGAAGTLQAAVTTAGEPAVTVTRTGRKVFIPLQFWFCRNIGLALPLIALQYHEVKVNITFSVSTDLVISTGGAPTIGALTDASLWVDYIYLDTDERRRFAQVSHEYLIEQLQVNDDTYAAGAVSKSINLNFNHPVKELVWVCQDAPAGVAAEPSSYIMGDDAMTALDNFADVNSVGVNPVATAKLQLNGHDRFAERVGNYFSRVQPYQHHTCIASPGINVYSFALKPEEHQPSGTCNFSRIDNAKLSITPVAAANGGTVRVFATNYNVLRVMSGMGGLAYSN
jgi:hypothetical protein